MNYARDAILCCSDSFEFNSQFDATISILIRLYQRKNSILMDQARSNVIDSSFLSLRLTSQPKRRINTCPATILMLVEIQFSLILTRNQRFKKVGYEWDSRYFSDLNFDTVNVGLVMILKIWFTQFFSNLQQKSN